MSNIHKTAIIEDGAKIGNNVTIGAYSVIGSNCVIGNDVQIKSHVVIEGYTKIGDKTKIFSFASIGSAPQDLKFQGEKSELIIGKNNVIREYVTMNPGTVGDNLLTKIGDNCLFMIGAHVAHDCVVGNNVILANNATLAGHVKVGEFVIIGGLSAVHQFVRIGRNAMIGGMSGIENDIIPFGQANGERASLTGVNLVGLKRGDFEREDINAVRAAYNILFAKDGTLKERIEKTSNEFADNKLVTKIIDFIKQSGSRAICQPNNSN